MHDNPTHLTKMTCDSDSDIDTDMLIKSGHIS